MDICLVGVGVLGPRHFTESQGAHINAIADDLDTLRTEIVDKEEPGLVADIAHRFWLTRDPLPPLKERAKELLRAIDAKIVGVSLAALNTARERIIVAGGSYKYPALQAVVCGDDRCGFRPTTLVTDADTAARMLEDQATCA